MSHSANSIATDRPLATVFYGGPDRGKVIQLHMKPEDLNDLVLSLGVYDSDTGTAETFRDWLDWNCHRPDQKAPGMILFDPYAPPKVGSVPVEVR